MQTIALVAVWIGGEYNEYFDLWKYSVGQNSSIDFFLFTDKTVQNVPSNLHVIETNFTAIRDSISSIIGFKPVLNKPYKLCDYKPLYGLMFADYLIKYDWWGYNDLDVIFGDIRKFISDEMLESYDKIFTLGHLTLFRNINRINNLWRLSPSHGYSYCEAFKTQYICHFDEMMGITPICDENNIKTFNDCLAADIYHMDKRLKTCWDHEDGKYPHIFLYKNASLRGYWVKNSALNEREYCYIHLQKRKMSVHSNDSLMDEFMIIPNAFIPYDGVAISVNTVNTYNAEESVIKYSSPAVKKNLLYYTKKIFDGSMKMRLLKKRHSRIQKQKGIVLERSFSDD